METRTVRKMSQFLVTNLLYAPDISDERVWELVQRKMRRDLPWLLTGKHDVCFSGIGQRWSGWKRRDCVTSHAGFGATRSFPLNSALAWLTHFQDALRLAGKDVLIVLAPTPVSGLGAALARVFAGNRIRLVVRVQGHTASKALYVRRSKWQFKLVESIEAFVLCRANLVLPGGKFTYNLAISYRVSPERIIVLPYAVSWAKCAEIADLPARPNLLFAGRLEKGKGVHILLQAMVMVRERVPDVRLLIAGDGSYRPTLEQIADSLGIRDRVSFLGWLQAEHLQNVFRDSWLLALPSIWEEGLGMVLVEAGLMGRPIVGSDLGGIRDIIHHGENGFLVPPGNPNALADAILAILQDRDLASRMGLANAEVAKGYLSAREEAVEKVRDAIQKLFNNAS